MDTEVLVEDRIEDGRALLTQLARQGFEVSVALWVRRREEDLWSLYIASPQVGRMPIADAYRTVYTGLSQIESPSVTISDIKLISADNPIALDAMAFRDRYSKWAMSRYTGQRLGQLEIGEAYIYPPVTLGLNRSQILQAVTQLMNRTGDMHPSLITLRDGTSLKAFPVGVQLQQPGGITVVLHNVVTGVNESFPIDELSNIQ